MRVRPSGLFLDTSYSLDRFALAGLQNSSGNLRKIWKGIFFQLGEHLDTIDFNFKGRFASYTASHAGGGYLGEDLLLQFLEASDVPSSTTILNEDLNRLRPSHRCRSELYRPLRGLQTPKYLRSSETETAATKREARPSLPCRTRAVLWRAPASTCDGTTGNVPSTGATHQYPAHDTADGRSIEGISHVGTDREPE